MSKLTIGVFFGSRSPEHDISIITGELVIAGLKGLGHPTVPVYLSKSGEWMIDEELSDIKSFTERGLDLSKFKTFVLDLEASRGRMVFRKKGPFGKKIIVDLAFPAFHGANGEDGTIQGLFEIFNIPYVGCGVTASALTMDKVLTKQLYEQYKIPTTKFLFFTKSALTNSRELVSREIGEQLKFPVFVKPARLGSSIGVAKVSAPDDTMIQKLEVAFAYDDKIIVEEAVENLIDITCCVIGNDSPLPSLLQESVFAGDLFGFDEKYLKGGGAQLGKAQSSLVIPARIPDEKTKEIRELATLIYKKLELSGIARIDFLYDKKTSQVFANEINTMPGTLYHHLWKASGIELPELLQKLVDLAIQKNEYKKNFIHTFDSDILKHASSGKLRAK